MVLTWSRMLHCMHLFDHFARPIARHQVLCVWQASVEPHPQKLSVGLIAALFMLLVPFVGHLDKRTGCAGWPFELLATPTVLVECDYVYWHDP